MALLPIVPVAGLLAVLFALYLAWDVLRRDTGSDEMRAVGAMIVEGANAFLSRQYRTISILAVVTSVIIGLLVGNFKGSTEGVLTSVAFLLGAACSSNWAAVSTPRRQMSGLTWSARWKLAYPRTTHATRPSSPIW